MGAGVRHALDNLRQRRNQLLVSVRDLEEARIVLNSGASVLDVKDPARGSLGRADEAVWQEIVNEAESLGDHQRSVGGLSGSFGGKPDDVLISLALGELLEVQPCAIPRRIDVLKIGLAHCAGSRGKSDHWVEQWLKFRDRTEALSGQAFGWIAVVYFDSPADAPGLDEVAEFAIKHQLVGLLIDSYEKTGQTLTDVYSLEKLSSCRDELVSAGLMLAIAGQIRVKMLPELKRFAPHLFAVRSAVCELQDRNRRVSPEGLGEFWAELSKPLVSIAQE